MDRMTTDRFFHAMERESGRRVDVLGGVDLIGAGIGAVLGMLASD
jgi:hypothetical protein